MASPTGFTWSDDRVELLKQRWAAGATAGVIAREFSEAFSPLSRSAVLGKINRLGFIRDITNVAGRPRKDGVVKKPVAAPPMRQVAVVIHRPPPPIPVEPSKPLALAGDASPGVSLFDLKPHHCRWPMADDDEATVFCGQVCVVREINGLACPYCDAHARMAYAPARTRSERQIEGEAKRRATIAAKRRVAARDVAPVAVAAWEATAG